MNLTPAAVKAFAKGDMVNFIAAATPGGIEAQEAAGQRVLVESAMLPRDAPWEQLEALGIKRGKDVDDIFAHCELPAGWKKVATEHSMYSDLLDEKGRKRGSIFYKAAFYDRKAHMHLKRRFSYNVEPVSGLDSPERDSSEWCGVVLDCDRIIARTETIEPEPDFLSDKEAWKAWDEKRKKLSIISAAWLGEHYPDALNPLAYWD